MTYAEMFLLVWAIGATIGFTWYQSRVRTLYRLIAAMSETTKRIIQDDELRDSARKLFQFDNNN